MSESSSAETLTRLKGVERPLTQGQIARWILLSDELGFLGIVVAHCHVGVEDGKLGHGRLLCTAHSKLAYFRPGAIGTNDHSSLDQGAIQKRGNNALPALVEGDVGQCLVVLCCC